MIRFWTSLLKFVVLSSLLIVAGVIVGSYPNLPIDARITASVWLGTALGSLTGASVVAAVMSHLWTQKTGAKEEQEWV